MDILELKGDKKGERLDIKKTFKWIIEEMGYEDFKKLTTLSFTTTRGDGEPYDFDYRYMVSEMSDSKKARKDYLEYYMYKLVQNLMTDGVGLK